MVLDLFGDMDEYLAGLEKACKKMRSAIADANTGEVKEAEAASRGNLMPNDLLDDITTADFNPISMEAEVPGADHDHVDMTATDTDEKKSEPEGHKKSKEPILKQPSKRRYIKDWDKWMYDVLKDGQKKTQSQIFEELHEKGKIHFKGDDQKRKMKIRLKKQLPKLEKKGLIKQISDAYDAPWVWTGGVIMH